MDNYTVYKHTSPGGKVYIGITAQPVSRRWHGGSAYRNNAHFYAAIKKYGWDNFRHDILAEGLSYDAACQMERGLIVLHDSTDPEKGYNRSPGGDKTTLGYRFSAESRERISKALAGKRKGVPHTPEHRNHIRQALTGRRASTETREKLRAALGDRFQTDTAREKQKANTPKGAAHHKAQAIRCPDTDETFKTIAEAAAKYGINRTGISACCRGLQTTAGKLRWEYIKEAK